MFEWLDQDVPIWVVLGAVGALYVLAEWASRTNLDGSEWEDENEQEKTRKER